MSKLLRMNVFDGVHDLSEKKCSNFFREAGTSLEKRQNCLIWGIFHYVN